MSMLKSCGFGPFCVVAVLTMSIGKRSHAGGPLIGTGITYQAEVSQDGDLVDVNSDFIFTLWDELEDGAQIGPTIQIDDHPVVGGRFTVELDFGSQFNGSQRFLEIAVRSPHDPTDAAQFTTLSPRQPLTAAPYALYALNAGGASDYWMQNGGSLTNSTATFVGIHRDTPVNGTEYFGVAAGTNSGYCGMYLDNPDADSWPYYGYRAGPKSVWHYLDGSTDKWHLYNSGHRLTFDDNGNVGIGTTDPLHRLHVESSANEVIHATNTSGLGYAGYYTNLGAGIGLFAQTQTGTGVMGFSAGDGGTAVLGETPGVNGIGVHGRRVNVQGTAPAVRGETLSRSPGAVGVHGIAGGTQSQGAATYGVLGESTAESGVGVRGVSHIGVAGETDSPIGYAGYFTGPVNSQSYFERRVGIGVLFPASKLHVDGDVRIEGGNRIRMYDGALETVRLGASGAGGGGFMSLRNSNEVGVIELDSDEADQPAFRMSRDDGNGGVVNIQMLADAGDFAPLVQLYDNGLERIRLDARGNGGGGAFNLFNAFNDETVEVDSHEGSGSAAIRLKDDIGGTRIEMEANDNVGDGAVVRLRDYEGNLTIELNADFNGSGKGRGIFSEIEITGGSDLSEQFDVIQDDALIAEPGMVVCIDEANPGKLEISCCAYDRKVAGIISGANGVRTGMYMGQKGSAADGRLPVALTGRVYCLADSIGSAILPGDLLTTSDTPGHCMKVTDYAAAQGAIIGKAMTALESGKGLVLVLVSLQ